jgi:hypothetical protein
LPLIARDPAKTLFAAEGERLAGKPKGPLPWVSLLPAV